MNRVEQIGDCRLILGDCREVLPTLGKVDAVVTDPPFNAGRVFANDNMPENEWRMFCEKIAISLSALNATNYLIEVGKSDTAMRAALDNVLQYRWAIVLNYTNAMRNGSCGHSNFGLVYWYGKKCFQRYMDRIDAPLESTIGDFSHPSPKQPSHYARLVQMFSPAEGTILDPFMGSGTTGVACVKLGRRFIGIEIEEKYFDIACRRIEAATKEPRLPLPEPKMKQEAFV